MEKNFRKMYLIFKLTSIKPNYFYSCSFTEYNINLQGKFNPLLIKQLKKLKFNLVLESVNGYVQAKRGNTEITLTD